jgi:hypothetical protein
MKLLKILTEENLSPIEKRIIGRMLKSELDPEDFGENFEVLNKKWLITDFNLVLKLVHVYQAVFPDIEVDDLSILDTKDFSNFENISDDYDDELIALSLFLGTSPFTLNKQKYNHYGSMSVYATEDGEYTIGTEEEADSANDEYVDDMVDNVGDYMDEHSLVDYLTVNKYAIDDLAREMAENRVDDMSDDEILEEAGYTDEYEEKTELESNLEGLQDEISDLESDLEDTNNEISSVTEDLENPENEDDIEYFKNELENYQKQRTELIISINEKKSEIEGINNRMEELGDLSNVIDKAKEELIEKFSDDIQNEIEYEGADYFKNNFGYSVKELLNSPFLELDTERVREYFSGDRAGNLGSYDGRENDVKYNDTYYVIYRLN